MIYIMMVAGHVTGVQPSSDIYPQVMRAWHRGDVQQGAGIENTNNALGTPNENMLFTCCDAVSGRCLKI